MESRCLGVKRSAGEMDKKTQTFSGTRRCFWKFFIALQFFLLLVEGKSEVVLLPPTNVHVNGSQLTWSPASGQRDVTYTAEYRRFGSEGWEPVPQCRNTPLTSCDVSLNGSRFTQDCVQLRVRAQRTGLKSEAVAACSSRGDLCSPDVQLAAGPSSLTVHLSRNHSLFLEHASNAKYVIYFGKEGEELKKYPDSESSKFFQELDVGQRFCAKVHFILHHKVIGRTSCVRCETIPSPSSSEHVITIVVVVIVLVAVLVGISYILICKSKEIKEFLRPPYTIPDPFQELYLERDNLILPSSPTEERCSVVSIVAPVESRGS